MGDSGFNPMGTPRWKFILRASAFSALISVTLSSLLFVLVYARPPRVVLGFQLWLYICMFTWIPAGFFGFAAGVLGGGWFSMRRGRIRSTALLLVEAVAVGTVLSLLVPPLESLFEPSGQASIPTPPNFPFGDAFVWFFSLAVGATTAILFAVTFRKAIIASPQKPHSDT